MIIFCPLGKYNVRVNNLTFAIAVIILILFLDLVYAEIQIPEPVPVPPELLLQDRSELNMEYKKLLVLRSKLITDIQEQRNECGKVDLDDENKTDLCIEWRIKLGGEYIEYENALKKFKKAVEFAKDLNDKNKRAQALDAPLTNDKNNRTTYEYQKIIKQFKLKSNPKRYEKKEFVNEKGEKEIWTFCNIFVWDVTRAMVGPEEEIPHWVMGKETRVNQLIEWLKGAGKKKNWVRVDARGAQQKANEGHPTIAIWKNPKPKGSGHVAIIRPGSKEDPRGVALAQAGALVLDATHLTKGFNDPKLLKNIEFWTHE